MMEVFRICTVTFKIVIYFTVIPICTINYQDKAQVGFLVQGSQFEIETPKNHAKGAKQESDPTNPPHCPMTCVCSIDYVTVNCSDRDVIVLSMLISSSLKNSVQTLDLSFNSIRTLDENIFEGYTHLRILNLQENAVSYIAYTAFDTNINLEELNLESNQLQYIEPRTFRKLVKLKILNLHRNKLSTIDKDIYKYIKHLQVLDLSHNNLIKLPSEIFNGNVELEVLSLAANPLFSLPNEVFKNLQNLRILNVSNSNLTTFPTKALSLLTSLESLDLSNNRIERVQQETVDVLVNLSTLNFISLTGNPLICDCSLIAIEKWLYDSHVEQAQITCKYFPKTSNSTLINVSISDITCDGSNWTNLLTKQESHEKTKSSSVPSSPRNALELKALKYNPNLGWYTAGVLFGMLMVFMTGLVGDKFKRMYHRHLRRKLRDLEKEDPSTAKVALRRGKLMSTEKRSPSNHTFLDYRTQDNKFEENALHYNSQSRKSTCSVLIQDYSEAETERDQFIHETEINNATHQEEEVTSLSTDDTTKRVELARENALRNQSLSTHLQHDKPEPMELLPGIKILTINPDCPLHGNKLGNASGTTVS